MERDLQHEEMIAEGRGESEARDRTPEPCRRMASVGEIMKPGIARIAMVFVILIAVVGLVPGRCLPGERLDFDHPGTFSIVAYDSTTGELGVAVQSKAFAVGAAVPHAEPGVGAIATQAQTNLSYGPEGIALLGMGIPVDKVVEILTSKDENAEVRQLGIVDAHGHAACYTGEMCTGWAGHIVGPHYAVQGNILANENVVREMARAFERAGGTLAERLLAALQAGQRAGGDQRGQQSAALLVVKEGFTRFVDLRVDDHETPIDELERLFRLHERGYESIMRIRSGKECLEGGFAEKAEREFEYALAIVEKYPDDAELQNNTAWALATGDVLLDDALRLAERAVELAPDKGHIWDTLGEAHFRRGELAQAIRAQEKAVELSPETELFRERLEEWRAIARDR